MDAVSGVATSMVGRCCCLLLMLSTGSVNGDSSTDLKFIVFLKYKV